MGVNLRNTQTGTYWKINSKGWFYRSEKKEMPEDEGWKKIKTKDGDIRWHQEAKSINGILKGVTKKEFEKGSIKFSWIELRVVDEGETIFINLPYKKNSGVGIHDYTKSVVCNLGSIPMKESVTFYPSKKQDENGYVKRVIYISLTADEKNELIPLAHRYKSEKHPEGTIPSVSISEDHEGNKVYDYMAQDKYIYNVLLEQIERFKPKASSASSNATSSAPSKEANDAVAEVSTSDEDTDLPF